MSRRISTLEVFVHAQTTGLLAYGIASSIDLLPQLRDEYPGASAVLEHVGHAWQRGITRLQAFLATTAR